MESQFTSSFWHYYIIAIVACSFIFIWWLLLSQHFQSPPREQKVETTGHSWDGIEE